MELVHESRLEMKPNVRDEHSAINHNKSYEMNCTNMWHRSSRLTWCHIICHLANLRYLDICMSTYVHCPVFRVPPPLRRSSATMLQSELPYVSSPPCHEVLPQWADHDGRHDQDANSHAETSWNFWLLESKSKMQVATWRSKFRWKITQFGILFPFLTQDLSGFPVT